MLDLDFFASIQALQQLARQRNIDELVAAIESAFRSTTRRALNNNVFLTLQVVMDQFIQHNGGNNFMIKHLPKEKLKRDGVLPVSVRVPDSALAALWFETGTFAV